jgi:N-acetylmuramoyl-L-alanine amidase
MRTTLESQPENQRRKADYEKVIRTFQEVYHLNPASSKTPLSLSAVAELYEEMGRVFSSDRYYLDSIKAYEFLISQYPHHRISRDALFIIGEIYRADLEKLEEARPAFQQFLAKYPKSAKAPEAAEKLKQVEQLLANRTASRAAPPRPPAENRRAEGPPEVTAIRRWVGPNYSRIVIGVEGEVKFETSRVSNPDRIVLDLANSRLSPAMVGKTFPVEDGFLRQIRVAQFKPNVTRVVLDVEKIEDYSVFSLPNPFRLVIDIHGTTPTLTAKSLPPKESPAAPVAEPRRAASSATGSAASPGSSSPGETSSRNAPASKSEMAARSGKAPAEPQTKSLNPPRERGGEETAALKPPSEPPDRPAGAGASGTAPAAAAPPTKAAAPTESGSRTLTRALGLKIGRIVIDPGHGGHDTGTLGPTGLREKDVVLDVAMRLKKLLERNASCEVVMTRSDDTFIPLEERTAIANEKAADLFVSIHANASRDRTARGIETYYLNFTSNPDALEVAARENATSQESVHELQDLIKKIVMTEKVEESQEFAKQVQREVHARLAKASDAQRDRGVKKAPFVVLIGANMPSILAEISFLTNPRDERLLKRPDYRQRIAEALYKGVLTYVNNLGGVKVAQRASTQESSPATRPDF